MPLAQTNLSKKVLRRLDALAHGTGRTRAGYLRWLIEMHTSAMTPKLELGLRPSKASADEPPYFDWRKVDEKDPAHSGWQSLHHKPRPRKRGI